ncbi:hypothetical protein GIB67_038063 [Kingdonia uniflora]|uniref:Uncharacterized protein n=1 Tax=Kingdonia uniflora TaxID=39325 RepID=A0A7J7LKZ1_9MAGN|nr:hypothetical protein GIB67_038063 [Kingdonia uniflora]
MQNALVLNLDPPNSHNEYTMVPAALYLGFAASLIWVGQGTYLTSVARSHAKNYQLHEGTVIGSFNGEFWGMFASHQFVGNLLSLGLLRDGKGGGTSGTTLLFVVFLGSMTLGTTLMCFLNRRDGEGEEGPPKPSDSFYSSVVSLLELVIAPLYDKRMLLIIPLIAYSGLQQAFVWAEFTKEIVSPALGVPGVGGSMAVYGAFDAICSLIAGRFTSDLSSITLIVSGGALIQPNCGTIWSIYPLLMAAMLGIGDGVFNTQLSAVLGMLFRHDTEGAFAQFKVWQSATIAVVFFVSPYITLQTMLLVMLASVVIAVAAFLFLTVHLEKAFSLPPLDAERDECTTMMSSTVLFLVASNMQTQCDRSILRKSNLDYFVPPIFAAVVVAGSAIVVSALGLWEDDRIDF